MSSPKKISIIRVSQQKDGGPSGWGNLLPLKSARLADKKNRYGWAKCGEKKWTTGYKYIDDPPKNRHLGPLAANGRCGPWNIRRVVPIVFVRLFLPGAIVAERWRRWRCGARPPQTKQLRRRRLLLVRHLSSRHGDRYGLDGRARRTFHSISTPGLFFCWISRFVSFFFGCVHPSISCMSLECGIVSTFVFLADFLSCWPGYAVPSTTWIDLGRLLFFARLSTRVTSLDEIIERNLFKSPNLAVQLEARWIYSFWVVHSFLLY